MKKIKTYEETRINISNGNAEMHIAEQSDNTYNIRIDEYISNCLRVGITNKHGITFMYWNSIEKIMNDFESGKLKYIKEEKECDDEGPQKQRPKPQHLPGTGPVSDH